MTSPNSLKVVASNFSSCICLNGAKSSALVWTVMPGSSIGSLAAYWITFSRVRLSPLALSTAISACAADIRACPATVRTQR
jgi:hypothetical protein